jgi:hypothetical protein
MPPRITTTDILILVIDNNQDLQDVAFILARDAYRLSRPDTPDTLPQVRDGVWTATQAARYYLADQLQDWIERVLEDIDIRADEPYRQSAPDLATALIQSAIEDVGWNKVAQHYIDKTREIDRQNKELRTS